MIMREEDDHLNNKPDNENEHMHINIALNKFDGVACLSRILWSS